MLAVLPKSNGSGNLTKAMPTEVKAVLVDVASSSAAPPTFMEVNAC